MEIKTWICRVPDEQRIATHMLEQGEDVRKIQRLLGHKNIKTTEIYTHITLEAIRDIKSPLDNLEIEKGKSET